MPKVKKRNITPVGDDSTAPRRLPGQRRALQPWMIIAAVIIPLVAIVGFMIFDQVRAAAFRQPVATVDGTIIHMDYFLKRARMAGVAPLDTLQHLIDEQIIKSMAPTFGITATDQEVDGSLLTTASSANVTGNLGDNATSGRYLTESEFKTWYRDQLKKTGLTDAEYRDMTRTILLANKLQTYLAARIPATADQIHLNVIVFNSQADASAAKTRIQNGDNFSAVAGELSIDPSTKASNGDVGWVPRGLLPYDSTIFSLAVGAVSDPVAVNPASPTTSQYLLFMVSEKASNRTVDDNAMQVLQQRALTNWLLQEDSSHNIVVKYDFNNSANQAWIDWQISKQSS